MPGDCFNNKTRAALGFEKTVEIPVKSEEYYHNQNRWDQKPRYGQCPQQDENQYINGYNADAVGDFQVQVISELTLTQDQIGPGESAIKEIGL